MTDAEILDLTIKVLNGRPDARADLYALLKGWGEAELTGYVKGTAGAVAATDTVQEAIGKLEASIEGVAADVPDTVLTGYAIGSAAALAATDTLLEALGKLEARVVAIETGP